MLCHKRKHSVFGFHRGGQDAAIIGETKKLQQLVAFVLKLLHSFEQLMDGGIRQPVHDGGALFQPGANKAEQEKMCIRDRL